MTTFAHLAPNSTEVLDPRVYATVEEYKASFGGVAEARWAAHTFKSVPDGTRHGAKDNGDGTYTNPAQEIPPVVPRVLSKTAFMDLCEAAFGGGATGRNRFGKIIKACAASADDEVRFVYERFQGAQTFDKAKVYAFMSLLISKGTGLVDPQVSAAERTAVNDGWPNA